MSRLRSSDLLLVLLLCLLPGVGAEVPIWRGTRLEMPGDHWPCQKGHR